MRPRRREQETPTPSPYSSPSPPPRQAKGNLSSLVVLPESAADAGASSEIENGDPRSADRMHDEAPTEHRRSRSERYSEDSGYGTRPGSHSSSPRPRPRSKYRRYDEDRDVLTEEPQHHTRSPYSRRPQKRLYDRDFGEPGQQARRSPPPPRRTPEHRHYNREYDQVGRPHPRGSPLQRRFDRRPYGPSLDRLPAPDGGSPFQRRPEHSPYEYGFERPVPERGRVFWGERGDGRFRDDSSPPLYGRGRGGRRFRDASPPYGRGRGGGRSYGRGRGGGGGRFRDVSPPYVPAGDERYYDGGFDEPGDVHFGGVRNDPNLAPRVGDWICKNPTCGNLNFARRDCCNKCNKFRFGYADGGQGASPQRRSYSGPPSPRGPPPPRFTGGLVQDRDPRRDSDSFRSPPPRGWGARDDPPGGAKFQSPESHGGKPGGYYELGGPRGGGDGLDRTVPARGRYDFVDGRRLHGHRGYDQRPLSPRGHWADDPRERSRSPPLPPSRTSVSPAARKGFGRNSYMGRGGGGRYRTWQE